MSRQEAGEGMRERSRTGLGLKESFCRPNRPKPQGSKGPNNLGTRIVVM